MAAHVRDATAVLDHLGIEKAMVVGGSMGGYPSVLLAADHPDRVTGVGLCDGGVALPVPDGLDPEEVIRATVGPTIARLDMTFESEDAYLDFWKAHPALAMDWNDAIERYALYDAVASDDGTVRSGTSRDAILLDGRDLLTNTAVHECISRIDCPIWLLRAPRNLLDEPLPLISDEMLAAWRGDHLPQLVDEMVPDVNHFTLFLTDRGASVIAGRIRESVLARA
jgi:pimeloyl-ACP methyl ester carboxylesterase